MAGFQVIPEPSNNLFTIVISCSEVKHSMLSEPGRYGFLAALSVAMTAARLMSQIHAHRTGVRNQQVARVAWLN